MGMIDPITPTQADRDAAADFLGDPFIRAGECDSHIYVQAFAAHRIAAQRRILDEMMEPSEGMIDDGWLWMDEGVTSVFSAMLAKFIKEKGL